MMKSYLFFALTLTSFSPLLAELWTPPIDQSNYNALDSGLIILEGSHIIRSKAPGGEMLALEDGALFAAISGYENIVRSWDLNEPVKLSYAKAHPFASAKLYLTAIYDNSYAPVELVKEPRHDISIASKVFHIDMDTGCIYVRDAQEHETLWQIDESDLEIIQDWQLGDRVCLGVNESWAQYIMGNRTFFIVNYDLLMQGVESFFLPVTKLANNYE